MKGILILEIPERCSHCLMRSVSYDASVCQLEIRKVNPKEKNRPEWCPIKPIPEKKEPIENPASIPGAYIEGYSDGWNDAIKEIEKGGKQ